MASVDEFVFLDDCQMPIGRSYVSRVQVRGRNGAEWLTVPVQRDEGQPIRAVRFADRSWARKHLGTFRANYAKCPYYNDVMTLLRPLYDDPGEFLAPFNIRFIRAVAGYLGLTPLFHLESDLSVSGSSTQRLIDIVRAVHGTVYVSGAGGTHYQEPQAFRANDIGLDIRHYQPVAYKQVHGEFVPGLSVLDALFHLGTEARALLHYSPYNSGAAPSEVGSDAIVSSSI
jgi:hypothetical protein